MTQIRDTVIFIQVLRGLAPLPVVFAHLPEIWLQNTNNRWLPADLYIQLILNPLQINGGGGKIGVIVFFLISGFIISLVARDESRTEFVTKRILRIFPALIAATFVGYATYSISYAQGWGPIYSNDAVTAKDFLKSAFMISWLVPSPRALSVAWSLMPELIFYGLVFLSMPLLKRYPLRATWALTGLCVLMAAPMGVLPYFHYLGHFTVYLPIFLIGRVLYLHQSGSANNGQALALLGLHLTMFCAIFESRFPSELFRSYGMIFNVAYSIFLFIAAMAMAPKSCPHWIAFLSKISYSLYLVHLSVGVFVLHAMAQYQIPFSVKFFCSIAASILVATASFYWVEKPSQNLARRMLGVNRPSS